MFTAASLHSDEALVRLIDACGETPNTRVARSLSAFLPPGWSIDMTSGGFGTVRTSEERHFLVFGPFGDMLPVCTPTPNVEIRLGLTWQRFSAASAKVRPTAPAVGFSWSPLTTWISVTGVLRCSQALRH